MQSISDVFVNQIFYTAAKEAEETPDNQSMIILITGFVVVFLVLFLLIGIIKVYSGLVTAAQNKAEKAKNKKSETQTAEIQPVAEEFVSDSYEDDNPDLQTVAVITAAVEAYYSNGKKVRITGIRPSDNRRNEWASAGLAQNIPAMRSEGLL